MPPKAGQKRGAGKSDANAGKKFKIEAAADGVAQQTDPVDSARAKNAGYLLKLQTAITTIKNTWPDIQMLEALPTSGDTGHEGMVGFIAPFNPAAYDQMFVKSDDGDTPGPVSDYMCGVNFFWQNMLQSVLSYVPIYETRVQELQKNITPGLFKFGIVLCASFPTASQLPRGDCLRVSPDEWAHAIVFKIAERLDAGAGDSEMKEWKRAVLSTPCTWKRLDTEDERYAEANSLRLDIAGKSRAVVHTPRQMVFNVYGFKLTKEKIMGQDKLSAAAIATFWEQSVRISAGHEHMVKERTIDTCITLKERIFDIAEVDMIVQRSETLRGPDSAWNSIWKLQEMIYRCGTPKKLTWCFGAVDDMVSAGKIADKDITTPALKTGGRSVTDVALACLTMKQFLLGKWLDSKDFPAYMKSKARDIFKDHVSYRTTYNPIDSNAAIDTTWTFSWPRFGRMLLDFLEGAIYNPTPMEESLYRRAVKNGCDAEEIVSWKPWCDTILEIMEELRRCAVKDIVRPATDPSEDPAGDGTMHNVDDGDDGDDAHFGGERSSLEVSRDRMSNQLTHWLVEPSGSAAMLAQVLEGHPLTTVRATPDSGNVMILIDCNSFGITDVQESFRACPMSGKLFQKWLQAVLMARCGSAEPSTLLEGDIFFCIDGGKDRKRVFTNPLLSKVAGKNDPLRMTVRSFTVFTTESSWRARRKHSQGMASLAQHVHVAATRKTMLSIPNRKMQTYTGSTRSDVIGPVELNAPDDLPQLTKDEKREYYGEGVRRILCGGKLADDDDDQDRSLRYHFMSYEYKCFYDYR